ncbi:DNA/RNA non-specific endonuclease [Lentzea sp.]|uniref:DNA/RNA non-specific endonuclease n=1 Tax=Lentzea sp. TaxID=56099 RepID=UPI002BAC7A8F|nr:DNA/RNA non-specific endonuclease [Lentzea sp.]HUQ54490.1 DNA/RNA non-specific endonuclease [Lentzea sp.]
MPPAGTPHAPSAGTPHSPSAGSPNAPRGDAPMRPQSSAPTAPNAPHSPNTPSSRPDAPQGRPNGPFSGPNGNPNAPHGGPSTPSRPDAPHGGTTAPSSRPDAPHSPNTPHNGPNAPSRPDAPHGGPNSPSRPDAFTAPHGSRPDAPHGGPNSPSRPDAPHRPDGSGPGNRPDSTRPDGTRPDGSRPHSPEGARPRGTDTAQAPHRTPDATRPDAATPHRPDADVPHQPDAPHSPDAPHHGPDADRPHDSTPDRPHDGDADAPNNHDGPPADRPSPDEAHARHAESTPAGISHHGGDGDMGDLPHRVPDDPRFFTADVHVTPDGRARIGGHDYTPAEYADMLRRGGYDGSRPVRLIGCDAGSNDFAQQLSRHLDAPVVAPTKPAWTDTHGRVFTSDPEILPDGTRQPRIPPNGEWETHHPDGSRTRASEDGFAPGTHDGDKDLDPTDARDRSADNDADNTPDPDPRPKITIDADHPDAPLKSKPFGREPDGTPSTLEPNTRYEVTDRGGRDRGTFVTDGDGRIVEVHTTSGEKGNWRPDSRQPFPNATYHVTGQAGSVYHFHTDAEGRTARMDGELVHTGSDDARRSPDQGPVGHEGRDEYKDINSEIVDNFRQTHGRDPLPGEVQLFEDVGWNGGHLAGTEFDGPGEYINMVPMLESLNQRQAGTTIADNFRALEEHWGDILSRDPKPKLDVSIEMDYPDGRKAPTMIGVQYWVDGVLQPAVTYKNVPPLQP